MHHLVRAVGMLWCASRRTLASTVPRTVAVGSDVDREEQA
jgi:hypothetical protein